MSEEKFDFTIDNLGPCTIQSPIKLSTVHGDYTANYVSDDSYVLSEVNVFDKTNRIILSKAEIVSKYATLENLRNKIRVVSDLSQAVDNQTLYLILK